MGDKTKIDWCDASWNPVTGCLHGCEYCYAERMAKRFGGKIITGHDHLYILDEPARREDGTINPYPYRFDPTLHRYLLDMPTRWQRPRNIFVCSMADLFGSWVPDEWIKEVLNACNAALRHRYLFLTKNPARYGSIKNPYDVRWNGLPFGPNFWYGATATDKKQLAQALAGFDEMPIASHRFLSVEPLFDNAEWLSTLMDNHARTGPKTGPEWVIFGAETGNRKGKIIPQKEWIDNAVQMCRNIGATVFMKESLRGIMGPDFIQEYPWSTP